MLASSSLKRLEMEGQILARMGDDENQTFLSEYAPYIGAETIQNAKRMTYVYALFFCFENLVRDLVASTLRDNLGAQ